MAANYDAVLFLSFGGPDGPDDVMPFLENVLRGRNVPYERMKEVAQHYLELGGASPINEQNRALIAALEEELRSAGPNLPIYFGNRNWHPLLEDTMRRMAEDGVRRALCFITSAYSSYSGCRQYREDIARAQDAVGEAAPEVDKIRVYFNHPGFVAPNADALRDALQELPAEHRDQATVLFTAHSIPVAMAATARYQVQLLEAARLVAAQAEVPETRWRLVWQSRSGPPSQPWLEPDVCDVIEELGGDGAAAVVVAPIGFISDHMEVIYDLDHEAREAAAEAGLPFARASTVGTDPRFVRMIRELIVERMTDEPIRRSLGELHPSHDVCPPGCCAYEPRRPAMTQGAAEG